LDGIRAYWNGAKLLSRLGKEMCSGEADERIAKGVELDGSYGWVGRIRETHCSFKIN